MSCNSAIYTGNTGAQSVAAGGTISLGSIIRRFGCAATLNGDGITLTAPGYYDVNASVTVAPTAAGTVTVSLYQDGVAVAGATASTAVATAGDAVALPISALARVLCNQGGSTLTLVLSGEESTVENVALTVEKI